MPMTGRKLGLEKKNCIVIVISSVFLAFGLYHVHAQADVTEGGVLGMTLLLDHWFDISPAVSGFVLNVVCYAIGWRLLGRTFILYSALSAVSFSVAVAFLDESLQIFSNGRAFEWSDIFVDSLGGLCGCLFSLLVFLAARAIICRIQKAKGERVNGE